MYSLLEKHHRIDIPQHAFDFVISDECHRSIYGDWRVVLNHFDAIQLGLTATPATHTVAYFEDGGEWVYRYGYWQAVDDGKVVPYETYRIETLFRASGLYYEGKEYRPSQIERDITIPSTNREIVKEFRENSQDHEKTLVFASNDNHAKELERIFRQVYSDKDEDYAIKITYTTDNPDDWLRRFRNAKFPKVAITVEMITTGVDVKPIENIIFIRTTQSPILYNQMVGRGTRTCPDIDKDHFTIFDCVGIVNYFSDTPPFNTYRPKTATEREKKGTRREEQEVVVADDVEDEVEFSGYIFRTEDGRELRPDDYTTAFEKYVDENKYEIDALKIIMESPRKLQRKHIRKLSEKLKNRPEKFTEEKLKKAYNQEMTDLIGFIEHALGMDDFPTTQERVKRSFRAWKQDKNREFNQNEKEWLNLIERHFIKNKTIKKEDFYYPPFVREGGWEAAADAFGGEEKLSKTLRELNEQVVLA